jgi:hypothetical protein
MLTSHVTKVSDGEWKEPSLREGRGGFLIEMSKFTWIISLYESSQVFISTLKGDAFVNLSTLYSWSLYVKVCFLVPAGLSPSPEKPPGLVVLEEFISEDEESLFLSAVDWEASADGVHYIVFNKILNLN